MKLSLRVVLFSVPVGEELLGTVVNAFWGQPMLGEVKSGLKVKRVESKFLDCSGYYCA
jgi:hypothetical protein